MTRMNSDELRRLAAVAEDLRVNGYRKDSARLNYIINAESKDGYERDQARVDSAQHVVNDVVNAIPHLGSTQRRTLLALLIHDTWPSAHWSSGSPFFVRRVLDSLAKRDLVVREQSCYKPSADLKDKMRLYLSVHAGVQRINDLAGDGDA